MSQYEVTFAGFGGQGIMTAGQLLAYTGMNAGKQVAWIPSYGPEMRGGTAYCTVVVSDERIGSPIINRPQGICVFNRPSLDKFGPRVKPGGLLIINSSLVDASSDRTDIQVMEVPGNDIAQKAGSDKATNMVILGAFVGATGIVEFDKLKETLTEKMGRKKDLLQINYKALDEGYQLGLKAKEEKIKA
ncbi:MAG: 2-oxoacid:ferredoxin oxidoreductase subunit gamma [candidate division Zixibacteria bacterium]|nr:2-oxoacid:ferredoxin oxidoreductase subunit gamma [candidate division Zixibacteria bacterium]NIR64881.1 2-oxoacid:ferredoxin oxidoreductase subunit gamma [candidate division Zixibacteria bacterium]NIS17676.1 2-oxoacid:ferredoxin oxidoreductase subunit gamma [candidate division Zixibacteria bacterium]NIS46697.1 2-oxoacid:ferredoxin oxidoreductase subunit gamma [candidate division Zixibacteria bacterium]NIT53994.1 2-oxoacid:ferredoxin oxidoreductase subunit gamma [candidate division Zixibacter